MFSISAAMMNQGAGSVCFRIEEQMMLDVLPHQKSDFRYVIGCVTDTGTQKYGSKNKKIDYFDRDLTSER